MTTADNEMASRPALDATALDTLFREARTHYAWLPEQVSEEKLRALYELMKWGPTSANGSPMRILFLQTEEAKARLLPALPETNVEKSRTAAVVALIAYDTAFYEKLPVLFPMRDLSAMFADNPPLAQETAFRNSALQGAYVIIAARALGLDCGPMSGFDADKVNAEFFSDGKWKINFICNLGYGDLAQLYPRSPRLEFEEVCKVL